MSSNAYTSGVPPIQPGQPIRAAHLEGLRQADQRGLPQRGLGAMVRQTPNGSIMSVLPRKRGAGAKFPFQLVPSISGDATKVSIRPGIVSDKLPINYLEEFSVGAGNPYFFWLDVLISGGPLYYLRVDSVTIAGGATVPSPEDYEPINPQLSATFAGHIYQPFATIKATEDGIDWTSYMPLIKSSLTLSTGIESVTCNTFLRNLSLVALA